MSAGNRLAAEQPVGDSKDPRLYPTLTVPNDSRVPIGGGKFLRLAEGDRFDLSADLQGTADRPKIKRVELTAHPGSGLHLALANHPNLDLVTIRKAQLSRGGRVDAEYDLLSEEVGPGLVSAVALAGAFMGDHSMARRPIPSGKDTEHRKLVDAALRQAPKLIRSRFDHVIPGISLAESLGL